MNYGTPVFYSNVVNSQLQTFQTYDTLAPGACIPQGTQLFSANGLYYLTPQNDGDLVLYAVAGGGTFYSNSYQNAGAGPFQLCMQSVRVLPSPPCLGAPQGWPRVVLPAGQTCAPPLASAHDDVASALPRGLMSCAPNSAFMCCPASSPLHCRL